MTLCLLIASIHLSSQTFTGDELRLIRKQQIRLFYCEDALAYCDTINLLLEARIEAKDSLINYQFEKDSAYMKERVYLIAEIENRERRIERLKRKNNLKGFMNIALLVVSGVCLGAIIIN